MSAAKGDHYRAVPVPWWRFPIDIPWWRHPILIARQLLNRRARRR